MELIGVVGRLQVQRASVKLGQRPWRRYDPAPLLCVPAIAVSEAGVVGLREDGAPLVDVHNREHPESKHHGHNGLSLGFSSHYSLLRRRFGARLTDGIAGENLLVQTARTFDRADLGAALVLETGAGFVRLQDVRVAEPCVEFSRFALGCADPDVNEAALAEALTFLRHGMRGYYATYTGGPSIVRLGDRVYRL
ncbi:MAG TPA: hypothetical protein VHS99_01435 [Chloroflexota bacterium]|jgi:hypothetical protein|nr:hypothetical protein [Chloroflexota bacterium]